MSELGPYFGHIFGDVIKGPALVLGMLLNPFLSLAFELVFWAWVPIILNPINIESNICFLQHRDFKNKNYYNI